MDKEIVLLYGSRVEWLFTYSVTGIRKTYLFVSSSEHHSKSAVSYQIFPVELVFSNAFHGV